ncbi:sigma-70 factor [Alcanivorax sp. S71-1-4]|jgi:biopolymer transport protein TolR|uniref:ExbD/TolR family protein n=1 Tax=Alcanivorax sp. S71-1-4 TaxID=1177159 RepID=UPI00135A1C47|nr:biopolymer transporter ExbD [Alcanivorax sp. S71-1-4]KAF0807502.1 sigma-70 factor [Alcanivorax sp. S71-1-4]
MRKQSPRAQRKARHYSRRRKVSGLNLTALMDIFTILVFFLLVNSSNSQQLPDNPDIVLPESTAQEVPSEVLTLQVSQNMILLQERPLISVTDAMAGEERTIAALVTELNGFATRAAQLTGPMDDGRELMIMADRQTDYAVLQRIMQSANQTEYTKLAFAVLRTSEEDER